MYSFRGVITAYREDSIMNEITSAIKKALKQKQNYGVGELYIKVSKQLNEKISMREFNFAYQQARK